MCHAPGINPAVTISERDTIPATHLMKTFALLLMLTATSLAPAADNDSALVKGTLRSPHSAIPHIAKRLGWSMEVMRDTAPEMEYDPAAESFGLYVPKAFDGTEDYGVLVFVHPGGDGRIDPAWRALADKHKLIWIGPNGAGNNRATWVRIGLALDAAEHVRVNFRIDPRRVYLAGVSGGGRISSIAAIGFPEVFAGGFYIVGCNFYRDLPAADQPGTFRPKTFSPPPAKLLAQAKSQGRYVFLTGETDINRHETRANEAGYRRDGFRNTVYLEVPGMGHQSPGPEWLAKGLAFLDTPAGRKARRTR